MRTITSSLVPLLVCVSTALALAACGPPPPSNNPPPPTPPPPTATAEAKPKQPVLNFEMDHGALKLPGPVVFESGKDILKPESDPVLEIVQKYLEAKPEITLLRIEGHTDNDGLPAANQTLSEARAMVVAKWLISKGVACKRLLPVGFGQTKPIAGTPEKQTSDEKAQNRRTRFVNAELKGKAIGGAPTDGGGKVAGDACK